MNLLLQKLPSLISQTLKHRRFNPHSLLSRPVSTIHPTNAAALKAICDSLRLGSNWDALSAKFGSLEMNEALVDQVLLELKRPGDARRALGFFHWSAKTKGLVHGVRSYSIAIHVLVGACMISDAKALIESILVRTKDSDNELSVVDSLLASFWVSGSDPFVFDLLVQSYSKLRMFRSGFEVCRYLKENGFCPSLSSFNGLLSAVEKSGDRSGGLAWEIYELMVRSRVYPNQATVKILIGCLCKEGKLRRNVNVLDRICGERRSSPNLIVNTSLILWVLERGNVEEGMELLKRMLTKNMVFDTVAYSLVVYAKVKLGDLDAARNVFDEMLNRGFRPNSFVYTAFVGACCLEGRLDEAGSLVDEMERLGLKPYDETLSFLVEGYARAGRSLDSLRSCERMFEMGLVPSLSAFNEMVRGLCGDGGAPKADSALSVGLERGFSPDEATYEVLIDGYGKIGRSNDAIKLFYEMEAKNFCPGPSAVSTFVKSLCRAGELEAAERYLEAVKDKSAAAMDHLKTLYETVIASFVEKGDTGKADRLRNNIAILGI